MAYEQKEGSGSLFKNDFKTKDTHPDYKGTVLVNGVEMEIAAWVKKPEGKKAFMSLNIQPKKDWSAAAAPVSEGDLPF